MSTSSGAVCPNPSSVTETLCTKPTNDDTLMVEGYGLAVFVSRIVMMSVLANVVAGLAVAGLVLDGDVEAVQPLAERADREVHRAVRRHGLRGRHAVQVQAGQTVGGHVHAQLEPALKDALPEQSFQFERHGYFVADRIDSQPGAPVFNRAVTLRDSWAKAK